MLPNPADPDDLLQVDTAALVPLLTKAVQDLTAQVADLQAQLAASPRPNGVARPVR